MHFAALSGDRNPMHLDLDTARLTPAGGLVVHGVHIVLWALETMAANGFEFPAHSTVTVSFTKFLLVGQEVILRPGKSRDGRLKLDLVSDNLTLMSIVVGEGAERQSPSPSTVPVSLAMPTAPLAPTESEMEMLHVLLAPPTPIPEFTTTFPRLSMALGGERVRGLALLSAVVGMVCPGLHSIFSGFTAALTEDGVVRPEIEVWTRRVDPRFRMVAVDVSGAGWRAEVSALHRFAPIEASLNLIADMVSPTEFVGRRSVIIGGSRGLGAATAKLTVAGGGRVVVTYAASVEQAERLRDELTARYGAHCCSLVHFEVGASEEAALFEAEHSPTHIYYFASPRIFRQSSAIFNSTDFSAFLAVYVEGFNRLVMAIPERSDGVRIFYPSSIAVEQRPKQMTAYAMAKAAGEILCEDLQRFLPGLIIHAPRLPRILTDQTAVVPPVEAADAARTMLTIMRADSDAASLVGNRFQKEP
jgi:hypothetical protein